MALGSFKQEETAQMFAQLFARVIKLERELGVKERAEELEAVEVNSNSSPPETFAQYKYYTLRVSTPDATNGAFTGRIMNPSDTTSKFTLDNTFTAMVTVDVPPNLTMPQANDIVGAFYAGPYAVGKTRWVLFGAAGGNIQCRVASEFGDYLTVIKINSGTTVGTLFDVAKPYALRKTPFDGVTINGVTRVYSTNLTRVASNSLFGQSEIIVPNYNLGADIIYIAGVDHSDVFVSSAELKFVDLNMDGRVWAAGE